MHFSRIAREYEFGFLAINAEIPSIAVSFGYSDLPVDQLGANCIISNFDELPGAVLGITGQ